MAKRARQPAAAPRARTRTRSPDRQDRRQVVVFQRPVQARYDAAQTTDDNARYWRNADGLSADLANSPEVRRLLRNRGRYESTSNGYCAGIVDTLANHTVGKGPRLQMKTKDANRNQVVEKRWNTWAKKVHLAEKLLTARRAQAVDGEFFLVLITNMRLRHKVKLDLKGVEPEMVTTPGVLLPVTPNAVDGMVLDDAGNPVEYHVLKQHPGGYGIIGATFEYDKVPADKMVHRFQALRPGQHRGAPEIMPSLPLYAHLRRYTLAVIGAAELGARLSGALQTDELPGEKDESPRMGDLWEMDPGTFPVLPKGYELKQTDAAQPTTTFGDFKAQMLNEIARPVSMPRNIAQCDSSNYNYSSGKLDHGTYYTSRMIEQEILSGDVCMDKIFNAWLAEAALVYPDMRDLKPALDDDEEIEHVWQWDKPEDIDEEKSANACETRLRTGQTSYRREFARVGLDADQVTKDMADDLGVSVDDYKAWRRDRLAKGGTSPAKPQQPQGDTGDGDSAQAA